MITDLPTKCYHSSIHFSEFYLQDGGKNHLAQILNKITSLTVTLYINCLVFLCFKHRQVRHLMSRLRNFMHTYCSLNVHVLLFVTFPRRSCRWIYSLTDCDVINVPYRYRYFGSAVRVWSSFSSVYFASAAGAAAAAAAAQHIVDGRMWI